MKDHVRKESHIDFSQVPRLNDSQIQNRESERLIDKYPEKRHHGVKRFNVCRSKIICKKNQGPLEDLRQLKPGWELRLESHIKRLWQQARIQKGNLKKFTDETGKTRQQEHRKELEETNRKILAKEGRLKRYWDKTKQFRQNRASQNKEKILPTLTREWAKPYQH